MHWTIILFLISVIISGIIAHLLHNSHYYSNEDPVKFPLILWIVFAAITLIPVINCLACLLYIIGICGAYCDNEIEFNDNFWLAKMYLEKTLEEISGEQNPTSPQNGVFIVGYDLLVCSHLT